MPEHSTSTAEPGLPGLNVPPAFVRFGGPRPSPFSLTKELIFNQI